MVNWQRVAVTVRVPATSANLGPGFDALGLALARYDEVTAEITGSGLAIEVSGEGPGAANAGEGHLVVRAMRAAFETIVGEQPPGLTLSCVNTIPQGRGLGSSAGAVVAGLLAGRALATLASSGDAPAQHDAPTFGASSGSSVLISGGEGTAVPVPEGDRAGEVDANAGQFVDQELLAMAADLEGHPDNAAACLAGGLTVAWAPAPAVKENCGQEGMDGQPGRRGETRAVRLEPDPAIVPVVCVPATSLATKKARQALPETVSHADAATNSGRSALLVAALTQRPDLLFDATHDLLHEPYRAALMPASADLISRLRRAGIPAVLSGAGPTVLAFIVSGRTPGSPEVDSIAIQTGNEWHVSPLDVDRQGATIQSVPPGIRIRAGARQGRHGGGLRWARAGHAGRSRPDRWPTSAKHGHL
ncbi:MAG TPA: homoserine kinase [Streptosporangiaceae bacterium]|nr:homoserine kinase [Streptosporangiaceae bacterium]